MAGIGLSVAEVKRWSAAAVREVFHVGQDRGRAAAEASSALAALGVFESWGGDTAVAARTAISQTRLDLDGHGAEMLAVAHAARTAADGIEAVQRKLNEVIGEAGQHELIVDETTNRIEFAASVTNPTDALVYRLELQPRLDAILAEADAIDDTFANAVNMADGDAPIPGVDASAPHAERRLQNQIDAFRAVFGHPPASTADWATAAALDPHSYEEKNRGVPANIVVGRIQARPGQGVVRANLFIPSATVKDPAFKLQWLPFDDNAGDNRGFDATAGPEQSRVAMVIDYENGLVVARQNPSVNLSTGQVRAGTPNVGVAQRRDGSLYIKYAAADPFSPGGETLAKHTICVQGQLAVRPGAGEPHVDGLIGNFPALEIYHDHSVSNGVDAPTTHTVTQRWPWVSGQWGPDVGLVVPRMIGNPLQLPAGGTATVSPLVPVAAR